MNRAEHYAEAERLLEEGVGVVQRIGELNERRRELAERIHSDTDPVPTNAVWAGEHQVDSMTIRMDELGKKVMGIWAQAQVHATLAAVQAHGVASQAERIRRAGD